MDQARSLRWAEAENQLFVAPLPALTEGLEARLVLNSRFAEPNLMEVEIASAEGDLHWLRNEDLEPRRSLEIDLLEAIRQAGVPFRPASVRVSFTGDPEMIQAWLLISGNGGVLEVPLSSRSKETGGQWTSFWDTRHYEVKRAVRPLVAFVNTEASPVRLTLRHETLQHDSLANRNRPSIREIPAFGTFIWRLPSSALSAAGSLRVRHDGAPGQVLASGYLQGAGFIAALPVVSAATLSESKLYDAPTLPLGVTGEDRPVVSILHPGQEHRAPAVVRLSLLELASGREAGAIKLRLAPGQIRSIDLRAELAVAFADSTERLRLQLASEGSPILAYGLSLKSVGGPTDVALIPRQSVHESGTYPIPTLEENQVITTFLNLGETEAELFAHLSWVGGEYALAPIQVAPGGAVRLDFQALIDRAEPDLLGRYFKPEASPSYFQWLSRKGSSDLLARTEVRRLDSADSYGLNCFGCCMEFPFGGIEPSFAAFRVGEQASFRPVEFIDTCSGTMGPFNASPSSSSYSSPLGWNYNNVWATNDTNQTVSFSDSGHYTAANCSTVARTFFGDGPVVADEECQEEHHPDFDPTAGCCGMTGGNVVACKACCDKEKEVADCRCDALPFFSGICKGLASLVSLTKCHAPCAAAGCGDA
ncbi:MAG: hypothetical protein AAF657_12705 [Acidobacteriota bacterium]